MSVAETLSVFPEEIEFLDVRLNQTYIQTVQIKNVLGSTCSFRIRPSNGERITIEPTLLSLAPGESKRVQVKLKLQGKMLPKRKGGAPYRDTVQLKADFFEKKFVVSIHPAGPPDGTREDKENRDVSSGMLSAAQQSSTRISARTTQLGASTLDRTALGKASLRRSLDSSHEPALRVRDAYEEHLKQLRAEHASELRARDMQAEKIRARLERALAEVEEWRRVASEGEAHRRRASELAEKQAHVFERLQDVEEREAALEKQAAHLQALQQQVAQEAPDLRRLSEMMTARDAEEREQRDAKVLRVLRSKDESIGELTSRLASQERMLEEARTKLAAAERAQQELHKQGDRAWREHTDAVASAQRQWRGAQEELLGVRAKLEDAQAAALDSAALQRRLTEVERAKARLEAEAGELLRWKSENEERCAVLQDQVAAAGKQDEVVSSLQQQVREQSEQLDVLVAELGQGGGATAHASEVEELRRQIGELRAANARLDARRADAEKVFEQQLQQLAGEALGGREVGELRAKVVHLQAALELSQKTMARSSVQDVKEKEEVIARLEKELQAARAALEQPFSVGMRAGGEHSPDSLTKSITLVDSDADSGGGIGSGRGGMMLSGSGGGGRREGDAGDKLGRGQDKQAGRERELESKLAEAAAREHKLRTQLARLEHIQKAAQGTALAQEQQLHRAVHAMGRTSDTLDAATAGLSLEIEQWRGKAEAAAKEAGRHKAKADEAMAQLAQYDSAVATLEKELKECKDTLHLYHDRIVALAGPEDKAVEGHSKWADKHKSGMLPLSSHLKATNKLGQEYAAEKRHLERSIAISAKALDAARAELAQAQALRAQENHEWQLRVREQATALQDLEHRLRTQRDDGQLRVQELQRSVRLLGAKSDTHKTIASLTQEVAALRTAEQRLSNDAEFFRARAGELDGIPMWARRAGGDGRCASSLPPWMYTHTHTHTHTHTQESARRR